MPSQQKGTILFDLDGTLTDPQVGIFKCIHYTMRELGMPLDPSVNLHWCVGPPLQDSLAKLAGGDASLGMKALRIYREEYGRSGLFENQVYEGIPEGLAALQPFFKLYVATSKLQPYAQRIIEHFKLDGFFGGIYGCEADGTHSDKAELINHLLKIEKPQTPIFMVGDREHDVIAALNNHIEPVGVTWGFGTEEELRRAGAKRILHHFSELPGAFIHF